MSRPTPNRFVILAAAVLALTSPGALAQVQTPAAPEDDVLQAGRTVSFDATRTIGGRIVPYSGRYAAVADGRIWYEVIGDLGSGKTPVLVLHGAFMSIDTMRPLTDLITDRPLIVVDQRGHGRTGDLPGPITSQILADDAAAVLADAGVPKADVFGYSMGAGAALQLALRHPERVDHLVIASASFNEAGTLPGFTQQMESLTPEVFAGSPMEAEFKRLSPTPDAFPSVVDKIRAMVRGQDWPAAQIRALTSPTFIIIGDHDMVRPEHAVELYRLRGGGDTARASQPFLTEAPPARLAILPGASHIDVFGDPALLAAMILPFLDDRTRPMPGGLLGDAPGGE